MRDLRDKLPRASWEIGRRDGPPQSVTLHFFGPGAPNYADDAAAIRAMAGAARNRHMAAPAAGGLGADGLQYHYFIPASGTVYQARDERSVLWHSANGTGNRTSIAINLPLDSLHDATPPQWAAFGQLAMSIIDRHDLAGRQAVLRHQDWPRSDGKPQKGCPGPLLIRRLRLWKGQLPATAITSYRVSVDVALIREGPGQQYKIALNGFARLHKGDAFTADAIVQGTPPKGSQDARWAHAGTQVGFVHMSCLEPA